MSCAIAYTPVLHFDDINGRPLVGGKLYTYKAGTSTPTPTYTNKYGTTPNTNPVILNERGECQAWLVEGKRYKFVLKDALDTTIWEKDDISVPVGIAGSEEDLDLMWGHWQSDDSWHDIDGNGNFYLGDFKKAEGYLGGPPTTGLAEETKVELPEGLYSFDLELAFQSSSHAYGFVRYDLEVRYGNNTLRSMTFTFEDVSSTQNFTSWCGGLFKMERYGTIDFRVRRVTGTANCKLKLSHFFAHVVK